MSKIFDAYRKQVGEAPDLAFEINRTGGISLFQGLVGRQGEEFRNLANRLLNLRIEERGAVLSFASSSPGEGSSFVSYNAAAALASIYHQKVIWLDGNFMSPQKKLQASQETSFATLLQEPRQAVSLPVNENPLLIPGGANLMGARGLFADHNYQDLLSLLAGRFDFVIIDMPPILNCTDTALMVSETDGLLLVIEQRYLKYEVIQHGIKTLEEKGVRMIGSVINQRKYDLPKVIYDRL